MSDLLEVAQFWAHGQKDGECDASRLARSWLRQRIRIAELEVANRRLRDVYDSAHARLAEIRAQRDRLAEALRAADALAPFGGNGGQDAIDEWECRREAALSELEEKR